MNNEPNMNLVHCHLYHEIRWNFKQICEFKTIDIMINSIVNFISQKRIIFFANLVIDSYLFVKCPFVVKIRDTQKSIHSLNWL